MMMKVNKYYMLLIEFGSSLFKIENNKLDKGFPFWETAVPNVATSSTLVKVWVIGAAYQ